MGLVTKYLSDQSGASAAEYAIILAVVGLGVVTAANVLKSSINGAMNNASKCMNSSASGTCA